MPSGQGWPVILAWTAGDAMEGTSHTGGGARTGGGVTGHRTVFLFCFKEGYFSYMADVKWFFAVWCGKGVDCERAPVPGPRAGLAWLARPVQRSPAPWFGPLAHGSRFVYIALHEKYWKGVAGWWPLRVSNKRLTVKGLIDGDGNWRRRDEYF